MLFGILLVMSSLDVPYFKQDTDYTCGPTALQMVLAYHHVKDSERHLATLLKTNRERGTWRVAMYKLATDLGFHCYVNDDAAMPELSFLLSLQIPPIVRFLDRDANEDHYGVVVGMTDEHVLIHDPWSGPYRRFDKADFSERWTCDSIGDCNQWLMGVSKNPLPLGHQFHPHG